MMSNEKVVEIMMKFFPDEPCNYNGMDELSDDWCEKHCGRVRTEKCWEHAIKERWYDKV